MAVPCDYELTGSVPWYLEGNLVRAHAGLAAATVRRQLHALMMGGSVCVISERETRRSDGCIRRLPVESERGFGAVIGDGFGETIGALCRPDFGELIGDLFIGDVIVVST
jgi:hypothetical protein